MTRTLEDLDDEVTQLRELVTRLTPKEGEIRVGDSVFFFANDAPGTPPALAQVTNVCAPFLVDLMYWNGESMVGKKSVHSRQFAIQKQMSKTQITQMGIWDTIESHYKTVDTEKARLDKLRTDREKEVRERWAKENPEKAAAIAAKAAQPQVAATAPAEQPQRRPAGKV